MKGTLIPIRAFHLRFIWSNYARRREKRPWKRKRKKVCESIRRCMARNQFPTSIFVSIFSLNHSMPKLVGNLCFKSRMLLEGRTEREETKESEGMCEGILWCRINFGTLLVDFLGFPAAIFSPLENVLSQLKFCHSSSINVPAAERQMSRNRANRRREVLQNEPVVKKNDVRVPRAKNGEKQWKIHDKNKA